MCRRSVTTAHYVVVAIARLQEIRQTASRATIAVAAAVALLLVSHAFTDRRYDFHEHHFDGDHGEQQHEYTDVCVHWVAECTAVVAATVIDRCVHGQIARNWRFAGGKQLPHRSNELKHFCCVRFKLARQSDRERERESMTIYCNLHCTTPDTICQLLCALVQMRRRYAVWTDDCFDLLWMVGARFIRAKRVRAAECALCTVCR